MNILHLTPDFNYTDGRSYYVYLLLKYLRRSGHNIFLCTNRGDSFDRLNDEGVPFFTFKKLSDKTSFAKSIRFISDIVKKNEIRIIHSHHRYYELLANSLPQRRKKILHTVFTALSIVDRRYFVEYKSDKIIAVSNCVKQMLLKKFNVSENKIELITNFTDSEELISSTSSDKKTKMFSVLSIGRFHKEKDFPTLLRAMSLLKQKKHEIKLTMIGEGEELPNYEKIIKDNNLNAEIISPQRELGKYYEEADVCVLPSVREPFPTFMLQSGLHRKPFIGSDTDGIKELITDGRNGLLFEAGNEKMLTEKMIQFMEDKKFATSCSETLYKEVALNYTEKANIPKIEKLYREL